ncbi:cobalamin biosynthesis protein, membrane protein-like protein [Ramlibacter tataouinensis TTB310]|uniref:Cobalamin biosynthesis protein CobD n=2 Tax=Ramlibacter tataouinensis TaxID=94132 RepID=F5Y649_RAMTT|nr:cobalamin biosynthesis protein, membrane protein-like protein [Ramlibacter tataouinensis TTB310]
MLAGAVALAVAFALDRWLGEPPARWHPVVGMGRYLGWIGGRVAPREERPDPDWLAFWAGALAWSGAALLLALAAWMVQRWLLGLPALAAGLLLGLLLKPLLSWRMLREEVAAVEDALAGSLDDGRRRLARLVSRDVSQLDEAQVRESAIESLAENYNDSVVAPVFWFAVAGLPGAVLYRFANTADAMWGYRGFRGGLHWEWAGKWTARADDALSWLPARLAALLLALAAARRLPGLRGQSALTPSPNGGWPMAAMALALGVRLRKPGVYALNAGAPSPAPMHTRQALRLCGRALPLLLACAWLLAAAVQGAWLR